jgi:hypothetical protein
MSIAVQSALTLRTVVSKRFKAGAATVDISTVDTQAATLRRVGNFVLPFTMAISPDYSYASSPTSTVTSGTITAIVAGGRGPYTYTSTVLSYTATTPPSLSTPALASFYAVQTGVPSGLTRSAVLQCVATDFYGSTATATATIEFEHTSNS